jgi:hypothetical protein
MTDASDADLQPYIAAESLALGDAGDGRRCGLGRIAEADGRRLEVTDLDWSCGFRATLGGTSADLALVLCGRRIPTGRFEGESP